MGRWVLGLILLPLAACVSAPGQQAPASSPLQPSADAATLSPRAERSKAIAAYRDYLQRFPDSEEYSEVSRRLADLLLEEGLDAQLAGPTRTSEGAQAETTADRAYGEAALRYEELLAESPDDPEILYQLSRAYEESGQSEKALAAISRLLAQPASQQQALWSDTVFRQGELHYSLEQYPQAAGAYASVIDLGPEAPAYRQSLYKLGWSQVKQEQYHDALATFFLFIDSQIDTAHTYEEQLRHFTLAEREQLEEVIAVMGQCFGLTGGVGNLQAMMAARPSVAYEIALYRSLADWYQRQERYSDAAEAWLALVDVYPDVDVGPEFAIAAINVYRLAEFDSAGLEAQRLFVELYGPRSRFWDTRDRRQYPVATEELKLDLAVLANHAHDLFESTGDLDQASIAEQDYRDYLAWFHGSGDADRIRFQLATLLTELHRPEEAYGQYAFLAWSSDDPILGPEAAVEGLRLVDTITERPGQTDSALWVNRAFGDSVRFVEYFRNHHAAPVILARAGGQGLQRGEVEVVEDWVNEILSEPAENSSELGQVAFGLKAQAASLRGEHGIAAGAYRDALNLSPPDEGRRHALLLGEAQALFARGQASARAGEWGAAKVDFQRAAALSPDTSLRAAAEFDLAAAHLALEDWDAAVKQLDHYAVTYPDHELQPEVRRKLAFAHTQQGSLTLAADSYFELGRSAGLQPALRREALASALRLYQVEGQSRRAVEAGQYYVDVFPLPAGQSVPVMEQLAELEALLGNPARQREWLARIVSLDREAGDNATHAAAAKASLALADYRRDAFSEIRLEMPLQSNLTRKIEFMERALTAYESAIGYGLPPVTSAAMHRMATMYDDLCRALLDSERPTSLSASELVEYESLLAAQAAPFAEQAMEIYRLNAQRAKDQPADPWIAKSREQLQVLTHARDESGGTET